MVSQPSQLSLLGRKLSRLLRQVATSPQTRHVHHLRTSIRRLEASLDHAPATDVKSSRKLLKKLGKVREQAGKVRDFDVQLVALKTVNLGRDRHRLAQLAHSLSERRERQAKRLAAKLDAARIAEVRLRLHRVLRTAAPTSAKPAAVRDAVQQFNQLAAAGPAVDPKASIEDQAEALHGYRRRCKQIRYTAELAGNTPAARRLIAEMSRVQDAIGEWHDWAMLCRSAEKYVPGAETTALFAALRNQERARFVHALRVEEQVRRSLQLRTSAPRRPPQTQTVDALRFTVGG